MKRNNIIRVNDKYSVLEIYRRNGEYYQILLDNDDVDKVKDYAWFVRNNRGYINCYRNPVKDIGEKSTIPIQYNILPKLEDLVIDHINGQALDNRKENLRYLSWSDNAKLQHKRGNKVCTFFDLCNNIWLFEEL